MNRKALIATAEAAGHVLQGLLRALQPYETVSALPSAWSPIDDATGHLRLAVDELRKAAARAAIEIEAGQPASPLRRVAHG